MSKKNTTHFEISGLPTFEAPLGTECVDTTYGEKRIYTLAAGWDRIISTEILSTFLGTRRNLYWLKYVYDTAICLGTSSAESFGLSTITAFCWSDPGFNFYVRENSQVINGYSTAYAFNESYLASNSTALDTSTEDSQLEGFRFSPDGTKLYTVGNNSNTIYQYTLSTPWDLSTAIYSSLSKSVAAQTTAPQDVAFKTDGTKLYVLASAAIYQYTLSTPWSIDTATYDTVTLNIAAQETGAASIDFSDDGQIMFVMGAAGGHNLIVYDTNTPWDLGEFTFSEYQALSPSNGGFGRWSSDGLTLFTESEGVQLNTFACTRPVVR